MVVVGVLAACGGQPTAPSVPLTGSPAAIESAGPISADRRIEISGGPLGLDVADGHAWVVATDGGELIDVDLASGSTARTPIGSSPNWVRVLDDDRLVISRYGPAPGRATLELIDPTGRVVDALAEEPVEGLDVDAGRIWAFHKGGLLRTIVVDGGSAGQTMVEVAPNEHMDVVGLDDAAYAASDSTPVRQVAGDPLAVDASIETGGGVPFTMEGGLIWGARANEIWAVDPRAGAVTRRVPLTNVAEILDLDVAGDDAWVPSGIPDGSAR